MTAKATRSVAFFLKRYGAAGLREAVERAARIEREVLAEGWGNIPVRVERIAEKRGIRIGTSLDSPGCQEGRLLPLKNGFLVQLKNSPAPARQRFSLAHEVGHTLFYKHDGSRFQHQIGAYSVEEIRAEERICNLFAGALLMPALEVRSFFSAPSTLLPISVLNLLEEIARKFQVSPSALIVRLNLVQPEIQPWLISCFRFRENEFSGSDPTLRVEASCFLGGPPKFWAWRNHSAEGMGLTSVSALFSAWQELRRGKGESQGGTFALDEGGKLVRAKSCRAVTAHQEEVYVSMLSQGRWYKRRLLVAASSRLYAGPRSDERDAYIISAFTPHS